jgi:hypothetical protein
MTRRLVPLLLAALLLSACDGPPVEQVAPPPSPQAPPLEVSLSQNRRSEGTRTIQVKVGNDGTGPVAIEEVGLEVPSFEAAQPSPQEAVLQPGLRVDLSVTLGEARCDGETASSAGEPVVSLRVRPEGAQSQDVLVPLEPTWVLDDLLARECSRRAVEEAVDLRFGPTWTLEGTTLLGSIEMHRLDSDQRLTVTGLGGSILYNVRPIPERPSPLLVLEPGMDRAELPIGLTVARCDGHSLGESKRSFLFELWVRLGDDPERYLTISPEEESAREQWRELTRVGCGLEG